MSNDERRVDDNSGDELVPGTAMNRRWLLGAGGAAVGAWVLAACKSGSSGSSSSSTKAAGSSGSGSAELGPKRKLAFAGGYGFCPCLVSIQVGFRNACEFFGWDYHGFVPTEPEQDAALHVKAFRQALSVQPDAIGVGLWFDPILKEVKAAQDKGIYCMAVNTGSRSQLDQLGISYVGQDFLLSGQLCAKLVCQELMDKGKKSGVVLSGTSSPGSLPLEQRYLGIKQGTQTFNQENGTSFTNESFPDQSADIARAVPLYQAKARELGDSLVGFATLGTQETVAVLKYMQGNKLSPGQLVSGGFDISDDIVKGIRDDYLSFGLDQQFYTQGFMCAIQTWMKLTAGFTPPIVYDTGNDVVTKDKLDAVTKRDQRVKDLAADYGYKVA